MGSTGLGGVYSIYQGHLFFQKATYGSSHICANYIATGDSVASQTHSMSSPRVALFRLREHLKSVGGGVTQMLSAR